ncbi:MAG: hypothetical protein ACKVG4_15195 [Longimicrobiales bacterium]|jgi:hypothetical protein
MGIEVLIPIFGVMVVLVPIVGITTVLTIRLGGKPLIETLAKELRASGFGGSAENDHRITSLTEQVEVLSSEVHRLREAQAFDQKLIEAKGEAPS